MEHLISTLNSKIISNANLNSINNTCSAVVAAQECAAAQGVCGKYRMIAFDQATI